MAMAIDDDDDDNDDDDDDDDDDEDVALADDGDDGIGGVQKWLHFNKYLHLYLYLFYICGADGSYDADAVDEADTVAEMVMSQTVMVIGLVMSMVLEPLEVLLAVKPCFVFAMCFAVAGGSVISSLPVFPESFRETRGGFGRCLSSLLGFLNICNQVLTNQAVV